MGINSSNVSQKNDTKNDKIKENIKLFRKCFLIYLEEPKNYKFQ